MMRIVPVVLLLILAGCVSGPSRAGQVRFGESATFDGGNGYVLRVSPKGRDWGVAICRRGSSKDLFYMRPPAKNYGAGIFRRMPTIRDPLTPQPVYYFWKYRDNELSGQLTVLVRPEKQGVSIEVQDNTISNKGLETDRASGTAAQP
jgi:hypothetical protein